MYKRFVTTLLVCISCILCAFGFTACEQSFVDENGNPVLSVAGKSFVIEEVKYTFDDSVSAEKQEELNTTQTNIDKKYGTSAVFNQDGTYVLSLYGSGLRSFEGNYRQEGAKIIMTIVSEREKPNSNPHIYDEELSFDDLYNNSWSFTVSQDKFFCKVTMDLLLPDGITAVTYIFAPQES